MKKIFLLLSLSFFTVSLNTIAQISTMNKPTVMVLGVFHFSYPNMDRIKTEEKDQIDFTSEKRKREVEDLVELLKKFKPTKIAVEIKTWSQNHTDSLYRNYLNNSFTMPINESYQLGFRLAKILNLPKVYCIDTWGNISGYFTGDDRVTFNIRKEKENLLSGYEKYTDSLLAAKNNGSQDNKNKGEKKYETIRKIIYGLNTPEKLSQENAKYLNELSSFEEKEFDYAGTDWISASWINRNLRIFRNIKRITENKGDRILVIFGAGHAFLLNEFLRNSLNYNVVPATDYIKK